MNLYVYCLVEHTETLPESLHGIFGFTVGRLEVGDFSFLVTAFADKSVPVTRENALAHAAVIQKVLKKATPLPFRFGTLATEQQLKHYVSAKQQVLRIKLEQVRGCVEMNVKIISEREGTKSPVATAPHEKPGTSFLAEKRREILGSEARAAEAKRVAGWLEGRVAAVAKQTHVQTSPTDKMFVTAAHLVERDRVEEFRMTLTEARQERADLHFLVSGPWAPYSFANMDLEFKTHFGVS